jgi:hypothetical protein
MNPNLPPILHEDPDRHINSTKDDTGSEMPANRQCSAGLTGSEMPPSVMSLGLEDLETHTQTQGSVDNFVSNTEKPISSSIDWNEKIKEANELMPSPESHEIATKQIMKACQYKPTVEFFNAFIGEIKRQKPIWLQKTERYWPSLKTFCDSRKWEAPRTAQAKQISSSPIIEKARVIISDAVAMATEGMTLMQRINTYGKMNTSS